MSYYAEAFDDEIKLLEGDRWLAAAPHAAKPRRIVDLDACDDDRVRSRAGEHGRDGLDRVVIAGARELDGFVELLQPHAVAEFERLVEFEARQDQRRDEVGVQFWCEDAALALPVRSQQCLWVVWLRAPWPGR